MAEARQTAPATSSGHLPEAPSDRELPSTENQLCFALYRKVLEKATLFETMLSGAESERSSEVDTLAGLYAQSTKLLPLAFEAQMHFDTGDLNPAGEHSRKDILIRYVETARRRRAQAGVFALFFDIVLHATGAPTTLIEGPFVKQPGAPILQTEDAIEVLSAILNAVRRLPDYDVVAASRWIRCVTSLVLGISGSSGPQNLRQCLSLGHFRLVDAVVGESLRLAQESPGRYPASELEWLAAVLFNIAVDLRATRENDEGRGQSRQWAELAVKVADTLAQSPSGGDNGQLSASLRARMNQIEHL